MRPHAIFLILLGAAGAFPQAADARDGKQNKAPTIYVPYRDVASLIAPVDKAVLMERGAFEKLLAAAEARARADEQRPVGQVTRAVYQGTIRGETLSVTGKLTVVSMSDRPVAVPVRFGQVGLVRLTLDGKPAPLGYDRGGRLVLVVTGRGPHTVDLVGSARLKELKGGGMQFGLTLPTATAGEMAFSAPGDLEVHATVPVAAATYDKKADRTNVRLALGGHGSATVALMGNGRQEDERAILLGTAATTVQLTEADQNLHCLYTVQVLRRGVRELTFLVPPGWTVTGASCPALVTWSVAAPGGKGAPKRLVVRLRKASRGTQAVHIQASAPRAPGGAWASPFVRLLGADFEHGYLLVDTGGELHIRGQRLRRARRQDLAHASLVPGLLAARQGRLFYHWSQDWSVGLDLAAATLRRSCEARHRLTVTPEQISLRSRFQITAVGRELFDVSVDLPVAASRWHLDGVTVDAKKTGFEYRVVEIAGKRTLKIALGTPVRPEGAVKVDVSMRHVPPAWTWPTGASPREVALPVPGARAETVSGQIAVASSGDLHAVPVRVPGQLKKVTVGRMSLLGLGGDVQLAYTYDVRPAGPVTVRVSRGTHRLAADSIGLVQADATKLIGTWRITYRITRARARTLYLLADKRLTDKQRGRTVSITAPGRHLAGKSVVPPGAATVELPPGLAGAYDLWQLRLDDQTTGAVRVDVRYDWPLPGGEVSVPLVRPVGAGQVHEMLALEASEELDVTVEPSGTSKVDAIDLPPLPAPARRLFRAYRLSAPTSPAGAGASIRLTAKAHDKYDIPTALAADATFTTYLGARGSQRTQAIFRVVNAGMQFLTVHLPTGAELWSVEVAGRPAKPKEKAPGQYLVALPRSNRAQSVKVVYALSGVDASLGRVALAAASLPGVEVNHLRWTVLPPPGYRISKQFTDMDAEGVWRPKVAGVRVIEVLGDLFGRARRVAVGSLGMHAGRAADKLSILDEARVHWQAESEDEGRPGPSAPGEPVGTPRRPPGTQPEGAKRPQPPAAPPAAGKPTRTRTRGRYALPVELVATADAGPAATYSSLGPAAPEIGLTRGTTIDTAWRLGLAAVLLVGFGMIRCCPRRRAAFVFGVLTVSTIVAIWWPAAAYLANGAFLGALVLIPVYLVLGGMGWLWRKIVGPAPSPGSVPTAARTAAIALAAICLTAATARAAGKAPAAKGKPSAVRPAPAAKLPPVIVPYEGDPTRAEEAGKVLIPYRRYVELWNRAHPEDRIDVPAGPVNVALAGVRYQATFAGERMNLVLTARVKTFGKGWVVLPLPMKGVAVTAATLDGKPARLQVGPKGMILTLPGEADAELKVSSVTTPKRLGERGSVRFSLPPLPGAVLTVELPERHLELDAPGVDGALSKVSLTARRGAVEVEVTRWTVPLGMQRDVTLTWSPKVGAGAADRTLQAAAAHDVYAFHWALVGVSRIRFRFSAGTHERFGLLLPDGVTLTDLGGANLRDVRRAGTKKLDGLTFQVMEVRLHRPATKAYELTARWVGKLPALDQPARLALPRAADVGRESGTVALHAAGGMTLKVPRVVGGRRSANGTVGRPSGKGGAVKVATYYWPYRPFALTAQLSRHVVLPKVRADQLVRVDRRQVQLLVQAELATQRGRIFGASFALPDGYELLSAIGPAVEDHYEQPTPAGRRLHVNFRAGVAKTNVALVLVRKDVQPRDLTVPHVTVLDAAGRPLSDQAGRLAVQVARNLEAETLASDQLRGIPPARTRGWLNAEQARAVQFAYSYEKPAFSLRLRVRPQPTKVGVEVFAGLLVRPTSAWWSYRLRYRIDGTPIDQVRFSLPSRYAPLVAVGSPAMRSVSQRPDPDDGKRTQWTVSLVNEVTGTLDVAVNFAETIDASTNSLTIPRIVVPAPAGQREAYHAILAVQNASRHELDLVEPQRPVPLPRGEKANRLLEPVRGGLQFVHQSFTEDWSVTLTLTPAEAASRVEAVVDLMDMTTAIDRTGRCRYEVRLMLQNRTQQFLRVRVPDSLSLWSAIVAGQPVKPVVERKGSAVVLIPLVKTSPGGLPYDVKLYLAGTSGRRLGLLTELKPPAIGIEDVPVERTTWSLRLPKGYRYLRPGGNLSPVAVGGIDIARRQVRLEQSKRFVRTGRDVFSSGSSRRQHATAANWRWFNKKIALEYDENRQLLETNRPRISNEEYLRQKRKLDDLSGSQYGLLAVWKDNARTLNVQGTGNINVALNNDAVNGGVAEILRNGYLNTMPAFVQQAAEKQKKHIAREMATNEFLISNAGDVQMGAVSGTLRIEGGTLKLADGRTVQVGVDGVLDLGGQRILTDDEDRDKRAEAAQLLGKLQADQRRNHLLRQDELRGQLALLGDNRLQRYYVNLGNQAGQAQAAGQGQAAQVAFGNGTLTLEGSEVRLARPGLPSGRFAPDVTAGEAGAAGRGRPGSGTGGGRGPAAGADASGFVRLGTRVDAPVDRREGGLGVGGVADTGLAVAGGTFSLPVTLPPGGERWDFQGPTGEPVVRLLVVDERLIGGAHATGAVLALAVVVWLLSRLWRQLWRRGEAVWGGFVAAYVVLAIVLAALVVTGGMAWVGAFVAFGAVLCPVEVLHRLLARRGARAAA